MAKVQRCTKSIAQVLKERKIKIGTETISKRKAKAEERLTNYLKKVAKEMVNFPKYQLQVNHSDGFVSSSIYAPTESIWAPWSKLFKKGQKS